MKAAELAEIARHSVLQQLATAHDHWSEEEQLFVAQGRHIEANGAHEIAMRCVRAYRAELDDPKPKKAVD